MADGFQSIFAALKGVLSRHAEHLAIHSDSPALYSLICRTPSPFPQHKGQPMWFGSVRLGKAYVSYHLMPLYMNPSLEKTVSAMLRKRMQGKSCFNFKKQLEPELLQELETLTAAAIEDWQKKHWL